jgi:FkbM family methyltransferase
MMQAILKLGKKVMRFVRHGITINKVLQGAYLDKRFTKHINKKEVCLIFELGSRDGLDAIGLRAYYGATVYAFECNPAAIEICKRNLRREGGAKISLVEKAVWNENKKIRFYPVNPEKSLDPNIGAASCLLLNFKERSRPDYREGICVQDEITVDAVRLDTFCQHQGIKKIDMLCMDLEGVELEALEGCGKFLDTVKYIITEVDYEPIRYGQRGLYKDLISYLKPRGFELVSEIKGDADMGGNALFINRNICIH